jgi:predicted CoA-substrate-specific enzyme activase
MSQTGILLGIDIGSTTSKAVLLDGGGRLLSWGLLPTGHDGRAAAAALRKQLLNGRPAGERPGAVATGYGRALVDWADKTVTEITCHARGVRHLHPEARTILDIGGQDSKAIRLDARGLVEDFAMNDRCAAGTGSFLDVIAGKFGRTLEDLSSLHARAPAPIEISSTCVVFAETEVVSLLSQGRSLDDVLAGVQRAVARRAAALVKQVRPVEPLYFSGGVALNESVRREIEAVLGTPLVRAGHPQLTAAFGAALLAAG